MTKAYSYIRFSTPEQAKGDSLRRQLESARQFAAMKGLDLDDSLRDEGISAFRGKNRKSGGLAAFLKKVESGVVPHGSYLIVENLDRLSRQEVHVALRLFLTLIEHGIVLVTLSDNKVYSDISIASNPTELIVSIALMMRAHDESATKSKRLQATWEKKRAQASTDGIAMTKICPGWLKKSGQRYEVIYGRDEVVRRIYSWAIEGAGTRTIAKRLNASQEPRWSVKKDQNSIWHDSYIKKILENPAVYGEFTPRSKRAGGSDTQATEPIQNYFPAVIDRDTFFRARAALNSRVTSNVRSPVGKHRNILSGLIKCADCGSGMHYIDKGRRGGRPYLRCGNSLLGRCNHVDKYDYELIQTQAILQTASHPRVTHASEAEHHGILDLEIEETKARIDKLVEAIEIEGMSQALQRRLAALERQLKDLELRRSDIQVQTQKIASANAFRRERRDAALLAIKLRQQPDDLDLRVQATMMFRGIVKEIVVTPRRYSCMWVAGGGFSTQLFDPDGLEKAIQSRLRERSYVRVATEALT